MDSSPTHLGQKARLGPLPVIPSQEPKFTCRNAAMSSKILYVAAKLEALSMFPALWGFLDVTLICNFLKYDEVEFKLLSVHMKWMIVMSERVDSANGFKSYLEAYFAIGNQTDALIKTLDWDLSAYKNWLFPFACNYLANVLNMI